MPLTIDVGLPPHPARSFRLSELCHHDLILPASIDPLAGRQRVIWIQFV